MIANPDKYQALVLGNMTHHFNIKCKEKPIPVSTEIQLPGVTLDNKLKFDSHIASICQKVDGQVNALNRLKNVLPCNMTFRCRQNIHIIKYEMENSNNLPKGVKESNCINTKSRILKS